MAVEMDGGAPSSSPREKFIIAAVTAVLLAIFCLHTAVCWRISEDDAFFLDISWNLLDRGSYSSDTYGELLGHDRVVATIPPAFPIWQTVAVALYQRSHRLIALKAGQLLLLAITLPLLWWKLRSLLPFGAALACYAVATTDGLLFGGVLSNRYELWCVLACLALLVSVERAAGKITLANGACFVGVVLVASLSNLQLLPLVAAGAVGMLTQPGSDNSSNLRRRAGLTGLAAALVLLAGGLLAANAAWRDSFERQLIGMRADYAPSTASHAAFFGQLVKSGIGNLAGSNAMHSAGSLVFLTLAGVLACCWRRLGGWTRTSGWQCAEARLVLFYTALFLAALLPLASLPYVGPRLAPVFLLSVVMLGTLWRWKVIRPAQWKKIMFCSVAANYAGACAVAQHVYRARGREVWLHYGMLPVLLAVTVGLVAHRVRGPRLVAGLALAVVAVNLGLNLGKDSYHFSRSSGHARRDVERGLAAVERLTPASVRQRSPRGIVIYGDAPQDYLLARALEQQWHCQVKFRTFFPFFHYAHPAFGRRFVNGFDGDVVLLGPENLARLELFGLSGQAMSKLLAMRYQEAGRFTTSLGETVVLVASHWPEGAGPAAARSRRGVSFVGQH